MGNTARTSAGARPRASGHGAPREASRWTHSIPSTATTVAVELQPGRGGATHAATDHPHRHEARAPSRQQNTHTRPTCAPLTAKPSAPRSERHRRTFSVSKTGVKPRTGGEAKKKGKKNHFKGTCSWAGGAAVGSRVKQVTRRRMMSRAAPGALASGGDAGTLREREAPRIRRRTAAARTTARGANARSAGGKDLPCTATGQVGQHVALTHGTHASESMICGGRRERARGGGERERENERLWQL